MNKLEKYKIVNIIVCFFNEDEILEYAKILQKQTISDFMCLVIVFNAFDKNKLDKIKLSLSQFSFEIKLYFPEKNLGYLNGMIFGYNSFCLTEIPPEYVVMSNTDIEFQKVTFFEDFLNQNYQNDIYVVGPSVYSKCNCSYDNPQYLKRHSLKSLKRRIFIFRYNILAIIYIKISNLKSKLIKRKKLDSQFAYSVHGCFFFVRSDFFKFINKKHFEPLMYSEEAYIAEVILHYNKKSYYDKDIEVIHKGSTVTGKLINKKKFTYIVESLQYIVDNFYGN